MFLNEPGVLVLGECFQTSYFMYFFLLGTFCVSHLKVKEADKLITWLNTVINLITDLLIIILYYTPVYIHLNSLFFGLPLPN